MGRLRTWLKTPQKPRTHGQVLVAAMIGSAIDGVVRGVVGAKQEARISRLEKQLARFEQAVIEAAKQSGKTPPSVRPDGPPRPKRRV